MNIYVGNLPYSMTEENLKQTFEEFGEVTNVKLVTDKFTGKPRGFAFVDMANDAEAQKAIDELNGKEIGGRAVIVNEARSQQNARPSRSFNRGSRY